MALPNSEEVRSLLQTRVIDPELRLNIVDLGLIYNIDITPERRPRSP